MLITNMKVLGMKNPIGIDALSPTFSWSIETEQKNWKQKAYEIFVSNQIEVLAKDVGNLWHSGIVYSPKMVNIEYSGIALQSGQQAYWKVRIWDHNNIGSDYSPISEFEMGLLKEENWKGKWIGETEDFIYHIYRKKFKTPKTIQKARLYICGLGHYELWMNDLRVGDAVLEPGWTNYDKTCLYNTYDVTELLQVGDNAIGIYLGDGMYNVKKKRYVYFERSFGKMKVVMQLNITYKDGTTESIVTDENFKRTKSPLTYSGIYGGEDYDARLEKEDENWSKAIPVEAPKGKLTAQITPSLKVKACYEPIKVIETKPGVFLYDMGKNFSGWVCLELQGGEQVQGKEIVLIPAELITESLEPNQRVTGEGYCWKYICNHHLKQTYRPKFTYYGFRYVQVEGAIPRSFAQPDSKEPIIERLVGEFIYPDVEGVGHFTCSNHLFNQIHAIINQAILSNMKSILTDCPHREKLGWIEETHLIGPAIMYNYDVHNLYRKIQKDMEDAQHPSGLIPDICPEYVTGFEKWHKGFVDSPEWGSACIINPWYMFKMYGDVTIISSSYEVMKKYLHYLTSKTHHNILHHGLGDWLDIGPNTPHSQNTPVPVIATAIYYYDLSIMEQVAGILNKAEDVQYFQNLKELVKCEFNLQFFDDQTYRYATGSQAAQAMSLVTGLVEEKNQEKVVEYLVNDIKNRGYAITAGDIGHPFLILALTLFGRSDILHEMTLITDQPGYGFQVKNGATTLAEEWDGPDCKNPHGSQNHFMLGGIEEWFYAGLAGINCLRHEGRFDEILIKPHFAKEMTYVEASYKHPYGVIFVRWERDQESITVKIQLPPNTTGKFVSEIDNKVTEMGSGLTTLRLQLQL